MRRKIELYINGRLADLSDQSFVLFDYLMEDLAKPTAVRNSFSKEITLPGSPANDAIFGMSFRLDRSIMEGGSQSGAGFNAMQKTPFEIFSDTGDVLVSGYAKLNSVTVHPRQYKVQLYGGLGSFFYALDYDADGNKRSLADLNYLGGQSPATELDFYINTANVALAWADLASASPAGKFSVINFAPAYNGIPDADFDANKALVVPSQVGLQNTVNGHTIKDGYALVSLANKVDEWAVKDLRSYLQRPVVSMRAFWHALSLPENNGGFTVDISALDDLEYDLSKMWMTLPMLSSAMAKRETGALSVTLTSSTTTGTDVGRYDLVGTIAQGTKVTATLNFIPEFPANDAEVDPGYIFIDDSWGYQRYTYQSAIFFQLVAYDANNRIIGGSQVHAIFTGNNTPAQYASAIGFTPDWVDPNGNTFEANASDIDTVELGDNVYSLEEEVSLTCVATDPAYFIVKMHSFEVRTTNGSITSISGDNEGDVTIWDSNVDDVPILGSRVINGESSNVISYISGTLLRSGQLVTKAMLLSTDKSPADYMLSFAKMFGLYFTYDNAAKTVTVHRRETLYQDTVVDLSDRIDRSKEITVTPLHTTSKWYDFQLETVMGDFASQYKDLYGIGYGIQRVNTGYDFDANPVNLLDGVVFKSAVAALARNKYFNVISSNGTILPSVFIDKGNKYTLWDHNGETLETDISTPPASATIAYYNTALGYDVPDGDKPQFCDADGKAVDGSGVLLFYTGQKQYQYFKLTDDISAMESLNDGVPCWLLAPGNSTGVTIPIFSRYLKTGTVITSSLDFGVPKELAIPDVTYDPTATIYRKRWRAYLSDRLAANTKVMKCRVNLDGLQVTQDLLRQFYWYDGSLWVLNSIQNYSLTTFDPAECTFIQVQDKDNYLI